MPTNQEIAQSMIIQWACGNSERCPDTPAGCAPLKDKLAQFLRDKIQAHVLAEYNHEFGYIVTIYQSGAVVHQSQGRVTSASTLLDAFINEAQAAIQQFGPELCASFAPVH
jgi:hypothetical protein